MARWWQQVFLLAMPCVFHSFTSDFRTLSKTLVSNFISPAGGGFILLGFGAYYLFVKSRKLNYFNPRKIEPTKSWRYVAKGFIINGLSPMVFIFWIGTMSVATTELGYYKSHEIVIYFAAIVGTVFLTDLVKAKLADKLRMTLTPRFIRGMNIALGILMVIFGGRLFLHAQHLVL